MTSLKEYLCFGGRILVHVLRDDSFARIAIPNEDKIESYVLQYHQNTLPLEIKEFGVQWMDFSFIMKKLQIFMSNREFVMVGPMSQICLSLLLTEQFQYHF